MKGKRLYLIILSASFLLFAAASGCSSANKPAGVSTASKHEIAAEASAKQEFRTEELDTRLFERVEAENKPDAKLKILFSALNEDTLNHYTIYNCDKVLTDTMERLADFLRTEQGFGMGDGELEAQFPGVSALPLEEGRIITYSGKPETFGESADCRYVYYQWKNGKEITVSRLYEHDYLRFEKAVLKKLEDGRRLIFTTGITSMNFGSQDFLHAFLLDGEHCQRVPALDTYKVGDQELVNTGGFVPSGIEIVKFTKDEIDFEGIGENLDLKATYQESAQKFSVKK